MRPVYRVRQLLTALTARVTAADLAEADAHLPPDARRLFRRMPRDGQAHGLRVLRDLKRAGETNPSLLSAALLHDAGKSAARINALHRSLYVALQRVAPGYLARLPAHDARRPLVALRDHSQRGAVWARAAGCDELTVWLIEHHQAGDAALPGERGRLLRALQEMDARH